MSPLATATLSATARRFVPQEICAIEPRAWGMLFEPPPPPKVERVGDVAIVSVRGPLMHHKDPFCDSYDEIKSRVALALAETPRAVVLALDSPGGLVSGCFDTADEIRELCARAGVPLYAFCDGQATSAAYALACAASRIVVPPTGILGSIGVVDKLASVAEINRAIGLDVRVIASGARKTDGDPDVVITDEAVAARSGHVAQLAVLFFEHVARARSCSPDELRAYQAGLVIGATAVPLLADEVGSLDQMVAAIAAGAFGKSAPTVGAAVEQETVMKASKAYEDAIAALRKAAEGDDEEAKKAKRMLAAELADEPSKDEEKKDDAGGKKAEDPPSKDDGGSARKAEEPKKDEDAKAIAQKALDVATAAQSQAEATERSTLIASRPDLDESTRALLASAPIADVRKFVKESPRRALKPAADAAVTGTRGADQGTGTASRLPAAAKASMDEAMGLAPATKRGVVNEPGRLVLGGQVKADGTR